MSERYRQLISAGLILQGFVVIVLLFAIFLNSKGVSPTPNLVLFMAVAWLYAGTTIGAGFLNFFEQPVLGAVIGFLFQITALGIIWQWLSALNGI